MPKRKRPARPSQRSKDGVKTVPGGGHRPAWIPEDPNHHFNVQEEVARDIPDVAMTRGEYYEQNPSVS